MTKIEELRHMLAKKNLDPMVRFRINAELAKAVREEERARIAAARERLKVVE